MTDPLATAWQPLPPLADRIAQGRTRRARTPRRDLARLTTSDRDPLSILTAQNSTRVAELVPLRTERMSAGAFAFYRGTAALMAADLARDPGSGILVPSCGDAHVSNFGFYASPRRELVFDLNDFDEAAWAPWEWDLKRLITSVVVGGQASSRDDGVVQAAARAAVHGYARALRAAVSKTPVERYFAHFAIEAARAQLDRESRRALRTATRDAQKRTGDRAVRRITQDGPDGRRVFIESPPAMTHPPQRTVIGITEYVDRYVRSASVDIRMLMANYAVADVARRVVGVGSVGTRCYLVLFQDGDGSTVLLQAKEAGRSVLAEYGGVAQPAEFSEVVTEAGEGARVVALQRILQATSDPFLGHLRSDDGVDLYVRQFHDMKGGIEIETLDDGPFVQYAESCAIVLARAHSQSPNGAIVSGYLGRGHAAAESMLEWAYAYADLSRADYQAFVEASGARTPGP